ncbi:MAG: C39 family peptidase [Lachnospiraceae bacterium]|nr:C39 family peptidase [Lachnospiraceae bacterium]
MTNKVLARVLALLAQQEKENRRAKTRLLVLILSPVIFLLLLIALILYVITSPITLFMDWAFGSDEVTVIESFQKEYGYNQKISFFSQDYKEGVGKSYEDTVFADGFAGMMYYSQFDPRWAELAYGESDTIGQAGCGVVSMATVISALTGEVHDPVELAGWSVENGYYCEGNGSYHSLIPAAATAYGLTWEGNLTTKGIVDALAEGKLVVAVMGKGHFTKGSHFIVLRGMTGEGKVLVSDSTNYTRSTMEWELAVIVEEAAKAAAAGGPFWAIGNNNEIE